MPDITDEVRENRRSARLIESYSRQPAPDQTVPLGLPPVTVEVDVSATLYTRALGDTLISGHPDAKHGSGRGSGGDNRGSWSQVETADGEWTEDGRSWFVDGLSGTAIGIGSILAGTDTTGVTTADSSLGTKQGKIHAWVKKTSSSKTTVVAQFLFDSFGDTVEELGLEADNDTFLGRLLADSTVNPTNNEELKVEIELSFSWSAPGDLAVTDLDTLSDLVATDDETTTISKLHIGTDSTSADTSDTSLGSKVDEKQVQTNVAQESITAITQFLKSEPGSQPHDIVEAGVFDGQGTLLWRATFDATEKDDRVRLRPTSTLINR